MSPAFFGYTPWALRSSARTRREPSATRLRLGTILVLFARSITVDNGHYGFSLSCGDTITCPRPDGCRLTLSQELPTRRLAYGTPGMLHRLQVDGPVTLVSLRGGFQTGMMEHAGEEEQSIGHDPEAVEDDQYSAFDGPGELDVDNDDGSQREPESKSGDGPEGSSVLEHGGYTSTDSSSAASSPVPQAQSTTGLHQDNVTDGMDGDAADSIRKTKIIEIDSSSDVEEEERQWLQNLDELVRQDDAQGTSSCSSCSLRVARSHLFIFAYSPGLTARDPRTRA